mmetsp:Transcript_17278/g.40096  ORF Transcript_17278/g.40096 Transcript_17278/m.40096 type:complete len:85 (+) Transcript_17278:280-534(+)
MLHTKTTSPEQTSNWINRCHFEFKKKWRGCYVGFPWPGGIQGEPLAHREEGWEYNCFPNQRVADHWLPQLKKALTAKNDRGDAQ